MNEAELLFTEVLGCDRPSLYLRKDMELDKEKCVFISSVLQRRIKGEPIQYILEKTEFMGLEFKISADVLIPRPETEILVETVVRLQSQVTSHKSQVKILDIGTGSGCIAVSLARLLPDVFVSATDISEKALELARDNAKLNGVSEKIRFIRSDLFSQYAIRNTQYDVIVSNPPYICGIEIANLQPEIKHEPRIALDGGSDGLDFYRRIIRESPDYLNESGLLIMEIGFNQRGVLKNIFKDSGDFKIIETIKDYNNLDRVIVARRIKKYG